MRVATPEQPSGDPAAPADPENLSALIARVLNQLSLSAWLPGAFFIASIAALLWFRARGALTLDGVGSYVEDNWVPVLVLAVPALVITTLLTQAFSFEAIRSLEGYWRRRGPLSLVKKLRMKHHLRHKTALVKRYEKALAKAFNATRPALLATGIDASVFLAVEADAFGVRRPTGLSDEQKLKADQSDWLEHCKPWLAERAIRLDRDSREYPEDSRIMPTMLGNILRTAEDGLRHSDGDVEGFVMRNRAVVPTRVLEHHDQFRTRLDMYCTLVFVTTAAAVAAIAALWNVPMFDRIIVPVVLLVTAWASYTAALSSARGYSTVLRQIDESVGQSRIATA